MAPALRIPGVSQSTCTKFTSLCRPLDPLRLGDLSEQLNALVLKLKQKGAPTAEVGRDSDFGLKLARAAQALLNRYQTFNEEGKALTVGAVSYLLVEHDAIPDDSVFIGYDDDAHILNYVLNKLGLSDLCIPNSNE